MEKYMDKGNAYSDSGSISHSHERHSPVLGPLGFLLSIGIPAMIVVIGLISVGWNAISWPGAIIWGIVATIAFTLFTIMGKKMGITRMDLLDLLGSIFVEPHTTTSRTVGGIMHMMNGALLAIAWAYGAALTNLRQIG